MTPTTVVVLPVTNRDFDSHGTLCNTTNCANYEAQAKILLPETSI